jgi:hypothetical protein
MFPKGAQVLVTSVLSAPGEGRSRLGRKNLPTICSSEITSTLCTPFVCLQTFVCTWPLSLISAKDSSIPLWPARNGAARHCTSVKLRRWRDNWTARPGQPCPRNVRGGVGPGPARYALEGVQHVSIRQYYDAASVSSSSRTAATVGFRVSA